MYRKNFKNLIYFSEKFYMAMVKAWQKALRISEENYQQWKSICGAEESITSWALKNKKLPVQSYMNWALDYYKIPILKKEFFDHNTTQLQFWNQVKNKEDWNEFFLPIYQWENIIYAGCVEPPTQTKSQIVALLVDPEQLQFCWKQIQSSNSSKQTNPKAQKLESNQLKVNSFTENELNEAKDLPLADKNTQITVLTKIKNLFSNTNSQLVKTSSLPTGDQKILDFLEQTQKLFLFSIVFSYANSQFTPLKWNSSVEGSKEPIKTKEPSIFRIVRKSLRPYHGFVVENKQHRDFFKKYGFQPIPQHVTLAPVFKRYSKQELIGAFMGVSQTAIHPIKISEIIHWCKSLSKILPLEKKKFAS